MFCAFVQLVAQLLARGPHCVADVSALLQAVSRTAPFFVEGRQEVKTSKQTQTLH